MAYLNREVLRTVTLSVHLYALRFERETDHGVDLSVSELLGSSVGVTVAGNAVSVVKPQGADDALAATVTPAVAWVTCRIRTPIPLAAGATFRG